MAKMVSECCIYILFLLFLIERPRAYGSVNYLVARAVPLKDVALTGNARATFVEISKTKCLIQCSRYNCDSLNFGLRRCELFTTYLCQDGQELTDRRGYKHYDVENSTMNQVTTLSFGLKDKTNSI